MARMPSRLRARLGAARRRLFGPRPPAIVRAVRAASITYLEEAALVDLFDAVARADRRGEPGVFIEVGCALGGSALVMAAARAGGRELQAYDVFGMPPGATAGDGPDVHARAAIIAAGRSEGIGGNLYYGYVDGLLERVIETFRSHGFDPARQNIHFVKGLVQDTLHDPGAVAVAHIDCDRYASVKVCLERIAPRLTRHGVMIIDDYDSKSGCRRAVDEYLAQHGADYRLVRRARVHLTRRI